MVVKSGIFPRHNSPEFHIQLWMSDGVIRLSGEKIRPPTLNLKIVSSLPHSRFLIAKHGVNGSRGSHFRENGTNVSARQETPVDRTQRSFFLKTIPTNEGFESKNKVENKTRTI